MRKVLIAVLSLLLAAPAFACSVVQGYRVPGNFELIERADLVVLARVGDERKPAGTSRFEPNVPLTPVRIIKGTLPKSPLLVRGQTVSRDGKVYSPNPTSLREAHPSAYAGACIRQTYARGSLVLATFVKQPDGSYQQIMSPFARAVEDVEGKASLWVRAATLYAAMQRRSGDRTAIITAEAKRLEALRRDPGAAEIAADLRAQLAIRTPPPGF